MNGSMSLGVVLADVLGVVLDSVKLEKLLFLVFTQEFARPIEKTV